MRPPLPAGGVGAHLRDPLATLAAAAAGLTVQAVRWRVLAIECACILPWRAVRPCFKPRLADQTMMKPSTRHAKAQMPCGSASQCLVGGNHRVDVAHCGCQPTALSQNHGTTGPPSLPQPHSTRPTPCSCSPPRRCPLAPPPAGRWVAAEAVAEAAGRQAAGTWWPRRSSSKSGRRRRRHRPRSSSGPSPPPPLQAQQPQQQQP